MALSPRAPYWCRHRISKGKSKFNPACCGVGYECCGCYKGEDEGVYRAMKYGSAKIAREHQGNVQSPTEKACKGTARNSVFPCRISLRVQCGQQSVQIQSRRKRVFLSWQLVPLPIRGLSCPPIIVLVIPIIVSSAVSGYYYSPRMASSLR